MNRLLIFLCYVIAFISCEEENNDDIAAIADSLLFVKSIDWPTMTGSYMFIRPKYKDGKVESIIRGVNEYWFDSCHFYYSNFLDSAFYLNRLNRDTSITKLYFENDGEKLTQLIKVSYRPLRIDTFHFNYNNSTLNSIESKTMDFNLSYRIKSKYLNPYYTITKRIGFPYFSIIQSENYGYFYGNDLSEMWSYDPKFILDKYGRIIQFTQYGPPDFDYKVSYY